MNPYHTRLFRLFLSCVINTSIMDMEATFVLSQKREGISDLPEFLSAVIPNSQTVRVPRCPLGQVAVDFS